MSRSDEEFLMTLIVIGAFFIITTLGSAWAESVRCERTGHYLNYKTEWHWFTGCVVEKPDGNKVLLRQMRDLDK